MKGWRTIAFNVLVIVATIAGALIFIDWYSLGLSGRATVLAVIAVNLLSSGANIALRFLTTGPIGDPGLPPLDNMPADGLGSDEFEPDESGPRP